MTLNPYSPPSNTEPASLTDVQIDDNPQARMRLLRLRNIARLTMASLGIAGVCFISWLTASALNFQDPGYLFVAFGAVSLSIGIVSNCWMFALSILCAARHHSSWWYTGVSIAIFAGVGLGLSQLLR